MKKIMFLSCMVCAFSISTPAQEKNDELLHRKDSALLMKEQHKGEIINSALSNKRTVNHKKVKKQKFKRKMNEEKLKVILTPDQKQKMKERREPRRGATNLPNERREK